MDAARTIGTGGDHLRRVSADRLAVQARRLAIACLACVLYGSLLPFDFDWSRFTLTSGFGLLELRWHRAGLEDALTNLIVYMPIGGLLALACLTRTGAPLRRIAIATSGGFLLSLLAETLQVGVIGRVSSATDVALNTAGATFGAVVALIAACTARPVLDHLRQHVRRRPLNTLAHATAIGLLLASLAPFTFVTSTAQLHESFRRAEWGIMAALRGGHESCTTATVIAALGGVAWFVLLGYLTAIACRESRHSPLRSLATAVIECVALAVAIETLQLFTLAHVFGIGDIVLRSAGVVLGAWVAVFAVNLPSGSRRRVPLGLAIPTVLLALVAGCQLLVLIVDATGTAASLSPRWVRPWPFELLWRGSMSRALFDVMANLTQYGVAALAVGWLLRRVGFVYVWTITALLLAACALTVTAWSALVLARGPDWTGATLAMVAVLLVSRLYPTLRVANA